MKNRITVNNNKDLSNDVYKVSKGTIEVNMLTSDKKFEVLAVENNQKNGMQAMAVAPVDSNEKVEIL